MALLGKEIIKPPSIPTRTNAMIIRLGIGGVMSSPYHTYFSTITSFPWTKKRSVNRLQKGSKVYQYVVQKLIW